MVRKLKKIFKYSNFSNFTINRGLFIITLNKLYFGINHILLNGTKGLRVFHSSENKFIIYISQKNLAISVRMNINLLKSLAFLLQ